MPRAGDAVFNRPPPNPTTPIPVLITAAVALYRRTFTPLFVTAALIALVVSTASATLLPQPDIERPETFRPALFASLILQAVSIGLFSAVLWRAAMLHRGESSSLAKALASVVSFGPRCFAGGMLLSVPLFVLLSSTGALALPALALTVFVWVRASLYLPAVVLENRSIAGALARSWRLVEGRWRRTFLLALIVAIPFSAITLAIGAPLAGAATPVIIAVGALTTGVFVSFLSVLGLLLFEDYVRASEGTPPRPLENGPPTDTQPPR